ncbi:MAG: ATP-binding cassette domain-containing protein, partial [Pseudomonadota bacterium]|nr:ATP-binding cassette domain-containing protein [Pseudomonadota bacterium]
QDEFGRDELARLIWGARTSLSIAAASSVLACLIGTALGITGGFLRGVAELLTIRSMDIVLCFPPLLLAVLVVTLAGPGAVTLIGVLLVLYLPGFTRVAYAGVLSAREQPYVDAMRALGAGRLRIMLGTILPNVSSPVLVQASLAAAAAVVLEAGLSFLGLGVVPPTPSWGLMVRAGRATMMQAPALLLWPCIALTLTILAMNALCDGLRDWTDPIGAVRARRWVRPRPAATAPEPGAVLDVEGLTVEIATPAGSIRPVRDVGLRVAPGETLALVGESGSGKSMTGLAIMGLLPATAHVVAGSAWLDGDDLLCLPERALRFYRGGALAMVFQDPMSSLNPVHRVGAQLDEAIAAHTSLRRAARRTRVVALLRSVGLPEPARSARAFPHELSGGQRQRVMIAIAIANGPRLLLAD